MLPGSVSGCTSKGLSRNKKDFTKNIRFPFQTFCFASIQIQTNDGPFKPPNVLVCICVFVVECSSLRRPATLCKHLGRSEGNDFSYVGCTPASSENSGEVVCEEQLLWKETTRNLIYTFIMTVISIGKGLHMSRSLRKASFLGMRHSCHQISITTGSPVTSTYISYHQLLTLDTEHLFSFRIFKVNIHRTRKSFQQCHHFTHNTPHIQERSKKVMQSKKK